MRNVNYILGDKRKKFVITRKSLTVNFSFISFFFFCTSLKYKYEPLISSLDTFKYKTDGRHSLYRLENDNCIITFTIIMLFILSAISININLFLNCALQKT